MKKIAVILGITVSIPLSYGQKSTNFTVPEKYFNEGKEMFLDKNYTGAIHSLTEYKRITEHTETEIEADFMIAASLYHNGNANSEIILKEFLDTYPESYHRNQICFYIGSSHFAKQEWEKAIFWFDEANIDFLTLDDQEDYMFRSAYAKLQKGRKDTAKQSFGLLTRYSKKYAEPATYYLAYIDFNEGNYNTAIPVFEKLKNNSEYREEALFFLTQGYFVKNDLQNTINEGNNYLNAYPNSKNTKEIYRLLGNSYNRLHDTSNSISNYEKYVELEPTPLREDMFLLGTSYYQTGNYPKAVDAFKRVASTDDQTGQAAYMELGKSYLKINDRNNALMAFDAASRVNFDPAVKEAALYNYALLVHQTSLSVFDQSVTVFQRFLKEYPDSKYANQVNDILASTFLSTKNYNAALNAINEIKSPGRQILQAKQIIYFRLGTEDFVNRDFTSAARNFDECINMGNYDPKVQNESFFWRGEISYRNGNYPSAIRDYQTYVSNASASDINFALAYYNLGYAYFQTKQYTSSQQNFQRYIANEKERKNATYADALNRIGDCYLYNRNFGEAEKYYSQAAANSPGDADYAEFQKAFVMGLQRNYTGKINALDNMMRNYPSSQYTDDALFEKSRALVMLNREQDAINVIEKLLREHPNSSLRLQAGVQLGQLYFNTGNHNKSIEAYKRVINTSPRSEEARISIKSLEGVYKDINDINSYASYVNSLGMGTIVSVSRQDSLSYLAAENIYMKGNSGNSKTALKNYLNNFPNGGFASDARYFLGLIAFEEKDYDTALTEFNEVIKSNNRKYIDDALIYVSGIHFDRKNYQAAYDAYENLNNTAATGDNKNIAQLGMLRSAYLMNKDNEVINAANELLKNQKNSPEIVTEATYYRAKSFINTKQTEEAVNDFQVLANDTRSVFGAEAQYILAETFYKWKSYDRAIKQVQDFMKQGTPHEYWMAKALIVLSDCYAAEGDEFQAKQYIESLKANYKGAEQDIADAIDERLIIN